MTNEMSNRQYDQGVTTESPYKHTYKFETINGVKLLVWENNGSSSKEMEDKQGSYTSLVDEFHTEIYIKDRLEEHLKGQYGI